MRVLARISAVAVVTALLASCGTSERDLGGGDRIALPDGVTPFGATIPDVPRGQPMTFGALPVCSVGSGAVEVTAVSVHGGAGVGVNAFSLDADITESFGSDLVDLEAAGFDTTAHTLEAPCDSEAPGELAVELERTTVGTGTADGFDISYRTSTGDIESLHMPFIVVLCAPEDSQTQDC